MSKIRRLRVYQFWRFPDFRRSLYSTTECRDLNYAKIQLFFNFKIWISDNFLHPKFKLGQTDALYALSRPVRHILAFGIQTAVHNPDDYKLDVS